MECANALLRDTGPDFAKLTSLFGQSHEAVIELSDEVATVSLNAGVAYQRETGDDEALLKLCVAAASKLRVSERVSDRLNATRKRAIANIYFEREVQPLLERIKEVASIPSSSERFEKLQSDIAPIVTALDAQKSQEGFEQCVKALVYAFRAVSIKAHNEDRNFELAFSAIGAAIDYVSDPETLGQLEQDLAQLTKNKQERDSYNVRLKIRSTDVEITESRCRCNDHHLATNAVTGVRWGIYVNTVNGISSHYYTLWVGGRATELEIECKPLLRGIDDARRDYQSSARGLYYHVVPSLIDRIVKAISSTGIYRVGPLLSACNQQGITMSKGALFWKEEVVIPYADISMSCAQGSLYVRSIKRPEFNSSFSLRDCWNAVIFEEIVTALVKRKSSKQ
jgi:hypothetical protein